MVKRIFKNNGVMLDKDSCSVWCDLFINYGGSQLEYFFFYNKYVMVNVHESRV